MKRERVKREEQQKLLKEINRERQCTCPTNDHWKAVPEINGDTIFTYRRCYYCPACNPEFGVQIETFNRRVLALRQNTERARDLRMRRENGRAMFAERIGLRFHDAWFRTYRPQTEVQAAHLADVRRWATDSAVRQKYPFAFVFGPPGVGKTHLAVATWRHLLRTTCLPAYFSETDLAGRWRKAHSAYDRNTDYDGPSPDEVIDQAAAAEILILDDLGTTTLTDPWARSIFTIIDYRYANMLPTMLTSNFAPGELATRIRDKAADRATSGLVRQFDGRSMRGAAA